MDQILGDYGMPNGDEILEGMMDIEDENEEDKRDSDDGMLNFSDEDQSPCRGNKSALQDSRVKKNLTNNIFTRGNTIQNMDLKAVCLGSEDEEFKASELKKIVERDNEHSKVSTACTIED